MAGHSPLLITLMMLNILFFLVNQAFSFLNMVDFKKTFGSDIVLFNSTISDVSNDNYIEITPSSPTFSIWGVIYIWQVIWILYALVNICRRTPEGPVYTSPTLLTPAFFFVSILNWVCVITWTFVFCWSHLWVSFVFLALTFITIYAMIGLSYKALAEHKDVLIKQGRTHEIWLVRVFVHNGLATYGTWCTIATLLNLAIALSHDKYGPGLHQSTSSTISLSILALELVVFVLTDWTVMDKHSRYTLTPYLVVITALTGSIVKNWSWVPGKINTVFTATLLGVAGVCFIVKVVLMFFRHCAESNSRNAMFLPKTLNDKDLTLPTSHNDKDLILPRTPSDKEIYQPTTENSKNMAVPSIYTPQRL